MQDPGEPERVFAFDPERSIRKICVKVSIADVRLR